MTLGCVFLALTFCCGHQSTAKAPKNPFSGLEKRLVADGFNKKNMETLFSNKEVRFNVSSATGYFRHREATLNYGRYTQKKALARARKYMKAHKELLESAQKAHGVDPAIITAVLLVESQLGERSGTHAIFNTLATLAALDDSANIETLWEAVKSKDKKLTQKSLKKWAERKSAWAYKELKAFLTYCEKGQVNPLEIDGSYAGALGFSQFMPTSLLAYGADGNGDGVIDLHTHADAIFSIAFYLKSHGYVPDKEEKMRKALFAYNNSSYYVQALLDVRKELTPKK